MRLRLECLEDRVVPSLNQVVNYPIDSYTNALAVGDFNGDGKPDLAAVGDDTFSVLLGAGDGKFGTARSFPIGTDTRAIDLAVGDFNGDEKLDLATANLGTADIALLTGNGDGTFRAAAYFAVGASPRSIAAGDFNDDGKLDLATANAGDNNVSVLFGQGDGTFQPPFSFATGTGTDSVVTADFNGDGKLDLAVLLLTGGGSEGTDRRIAVLLGDGSGGFTPAAGEPFAFSNFSQAEALAVGDLNGDGKPDLAVLGRAPWFLLSNPPTGDVRTILGNGDGSFRSGSVYSVPRAGLSLTIADFNGDGRQDVAVPGVTVLLGNGDGTLQQGVTFASNAYYYNAVATGDFDGDGTVDVAASEFGSVGILLNRPSKDDVIGRNAETGDIRLSRSSPSGFTDTTVTSWSTAVPWLHSLTANFIGDGRRDQLVGWDGLNGEWWLTKASGETAVWGWWSPAVDWVDVRVGDFNGDGKADIVGRDPATGDWWIAKSTGAISVNERWARWSTAVTWLDVRVADFTGDGQSDLAGRTVEDGQWWVATSTGTEFYNELWTEWSTAVAWVDVSVGDVNGDGVADLVGRTQQGGEWWAALTAGHSFTNVAWGQWSTAVTWVDVRVADFDGNGLADIIGRTAEGGEWWVALSSPGRYVGTPFIPANGRINRLWGWWSTAVTWTDVQTGDFDNDWLPDLVGQIDPWAEWWVGLSAGGGFTNYHWGAWPASATWAGVRVLAS